MDKGPCNYDFAASTPRDTYQGPRSRSVFAGPQRPQKPQDLTPGEWDTAQRKKVGGARKRCKKGKSCSATCIAINEDCVVELPRPMQREIRRLAIKIVRLGNVKAGSLEDKRLGAGIQQVGKTFAVDKDKPGDLKKVSRKKDSKKYRDPRLKQTTDRNLERAERQRTTLEENRGLKSRMNQLGQAQKEKAAMALLQREVFTRGLVLPRKELEMIYDALPKNVQNSLMSSGSMKEGFWWGGKDKDGNDIFTKNPTRERGLAVFDMWFRQGGTDAYQPRGSKMRPPQEFDVEHLNPVTKGGKDSPTNWVLARSGAQRWRGNKDIDAWIDKLPTNEAEYKADRAKWAKEKKRKNLTAQLLRQTNPSDVSDEKLAGMGAGPQGKMFNARTLFTSGWQPAKAINTEGVFRNGGGPPAPFRAALAFMLKDGKEGAAKEVGKAIQDIWNKNMLGDRSMSPKQAIAAMRKIATKDLSDAQKQLFEDSLQKWGNDVGNRQYEFL